MKTIFKVLLCVCALSVGGAVHAGPKEDAIAAYDKGDFKRAARLLGLAAAPGNPRGQFVLGALYYDGVGHNSFLHVALRRHVYVHAG
jgi:hypothetical protein